MSEKEGESTSLFADVLAAVERMREDAGGGTGDGNESESRKKQKLDNLPPRALPERVNPPTNALPPRVAKPAEIGKEKNTPVANSRFTKVSDLPPVRESNKNNTYSKPPERPNANMQTFGQIQVSRSQTGNPLLEHLPVFQMNTKIRDVDYVINSKCVALFLSLRYHKLHPEYIYNKLKKITYTLADTLRVILVYVDIDDFQDAVRELNKLCLFNGMTLLLAWTNEQCANYLQNLKYVEKDASRRIIQGNRSCDDDVLAQDGRFLERAVSCVAAVRGVTQRDSQALLAHYGNLKRAVGAEGAQLVQLGGLGATKVQRLLAAFNEPFINE